MGSELVRDSIPFPGDDSHNDSSPISLTKQFYDSFPFYLSIGMTYDQYWNEDCTLVKYYRKAYELKLKQSNHELWRQGLYIYEALCDVSPLLHAFAKAGTTAREYTSEPYPITASDLEEKKKREEELRFRQMEAKMNTWAAKVNAQMAINAKKEGGQNE